LEIISLFIFFFLRSVQKTHQKETCQTSTLRRATKQGRGYIKIPMGAPAAILEQSSNDGAGG